MRQVDPKDVRDLQHIAADEGKRFSEQAFKVGQTAITETTTQAAREAILASRDSGAQSAFARPASAMDKLRREIEPQLNIDLAGHAQELEAVILAAITEGFATELIGSAAIYSKRKTPFFAEASVTAEDVANLENYPILGHSIDEWIVRLITRLEFDVFSVLSEPVTGQTKIDELPARLASVTQTHAVQCQQLANNAHIAGGQAAQIVFAEFVRRIARVETRGD